MLVEKSHKRVNEMSKSGPLADVLKFADHELHAPVVSRLTSSTPCLKMIQVYCILNISTDTYLPHPKETRPRAIQSHFEADCRTQSDYLCNTQHTF